MPRRDLPSGIEHGLSCKTAKQKAAGDYRYRQLAADGKTPHEIAIALGLLGDDTTDTPKPKPKAERARTVDVEPDLEDETTDPEPEPEPQPTPEPAPDVAEEQRRPAPPKPGPSKLLQPRRPKTPAPPLPVAATHSNADIRTWARDQGYEVAAKGTIPRRIIDAYWEAHGLLDPAPTQLQDVLTVPKERHRRPDWATVNLTNERDRARDLATRLEQELARSEDTRRTDLRNHRRENKALDKELGVLRQRLEATQAAFTLVLRLWDEATRREQDRLIGRNLRAIAEALSEARPKADDAAARIANPPTRKERRWWKR
ncbi:histone-like nucleoid-structuring protein Lsr2 [Microbacterium sp. NIBRBAC000506063]|uniref:Lsr2 family DNA-binding protein n=1 Tax=Microbacterium sp. NIBRBAC000506063 TaxID=2734618 RepID=UPI001BB55BBF|nr:histone-like nucleoid-structuring protein Lsr2 [Microbacterium sp. NIBRBAC000506063]QTV79463.1 Lsr2 family protein [Microbacterium sp. NIBRBAC000506063]